MMLPAGREYHPSHYIYALERQAHLKDRPIAEAGECQDHIAPEEQNVGLFREFHVAKNDEKSGLQKE